MKLDWQKIFLNVRQAGLSAETIARKVKMDGQTARRFVRGELNEPRFSQGLALLDLHHSLCPEKHRLEELKL